jgi:hypothetical protein
LRRLYRHIFEKVAPKFFPFKSALVAANIEKADANLSRNAAAKICHGHIVYIGFWPSQISVGLSRRKVCAIHPFAVMSDFSPQICGSVVADVNFTQQNSVFLVVR